MDPLTTGKNERLAVLLLCLLGAVHVFLYSAAFPFFSVVDEQVHLDLVVRYAHGEIPRSLSPPSPEALPFMVLFGTPEFLGPPARAADGRLLPPPWKQPLDRIRQNVLHEEAAYRANFKNQEAASPPLYYALAGAWWRLGGLLKLDGLQLLYWLRFLNVPLVAALVWLGARAARAIFPENRFIRLAVPALIAGLPQTTFYAINNDLLTPLTFGAAFLLLLKLWDTEEVSPGLAAATGLALAAAYLAKLSNLPLLAAAAVFLVAKARQLARHGTRTSASPLLLLGLAAALPIAAWMIWCQINFGDLTGSGAKIQFLNWTHKPLANWLQHPIFSVPGAWYFLSHNLSTFWQGEQMWGRQPLALPAVDAVYVAATLGALAFALAACLRRPPPFTAAQLAALRLGFLCVAAAFAFYALLSVKYDFQDCFYPSRARPYFVSGRLMLGMLVPFLLLFACGLDRLLSRCANATKFLVLFALLAFMLASEFTIDAPIFPSDYNWFHG